MALLRSAATWFVRLRLIWDLMFAIGAASLSAFLQPLEGQKAPYHGCLRDHRHFPHPQLLHRGAYRPRQIDAGRPSAGGHAHRRGPRHARPVPGQDGPGARARDNDQGSGGPTAPPPGWHGFRPEPDRYPRSRGLHLRGLAVAGGLRGRDLVGRRRAGPGGSDPGQLPPGARRRPRDRPRAEQDRSAGRRARPARQELADLLGARPRGHPAHKREDR